MKKSFNFLLLALVIFSNTSAQFRIKIESEKIDTLFENNQTLVINKKPSEIQIKKDKDDKIYVVNIGDDTTNHEFKGDAAFHAIPFTNAEFKEDNLSVAIQIKEKGQEKTALPLITFILEKKSASVTPENSAKEGNDNTNVKAMTLEEYIEILGFNVDNLEFKQYGIIVTAGNTPYVGNQYVHIFLDQYGNSIYGTMPQGISDRQYVVHVFYQTGIAKDLQTFDVKKTKGSFNPALNFLNSNIRTEKTTATSGTDAIPYNWVHKEFLIATSTTDIGFDLTRTTIADAKQPYVYKNEKIASYTINMTPVYHGSFNFGFINSHLKNPTYQLLTNPDNASEKVIKAKEGDNRGIVTVMATIYTSPIVLLRKAIKGKEIPWNKTYGRNFLDDHTFFERIYPAVGVGFTDKTFENIFYGFNWEVVRGAGLFFGWHWGKINTFKTDDNFKFEKTAITQEQFDLRMNRKWNTRFAIGANVDPIIVTRLFGTGFQ